MDVLLVSAARTLLVRDGGGGDNGGGKDPSKTYSDTKGKSTHTSTLHAADHKAQRWASALVCGPQALQADENVACNGPAG